MTLGNQPSSIDSWSSEHYEAFTQNLNSRPFISYVLSHIKYHMDSCRHDANANVSRSVSQLVQTLVDGWGFFLLESWANSHLNIALPGHELSGSAVHFRNQILHTATRMGFTQVVETLLIAGAQVEARLQGITPLIISAARGDDTTIRLLIDWDANKEAMDDEGRTALHHAAFNGHNPTVRMLIETIGVDKDAKDAEGWTAVHHAAKNDQESTVRLLVETLGVRNEVSGNMRLSS